MLDKGGVDSGADSYGVPDGVRQMDLASACVLHPLNHLVLDFETGGLMGGMSGGPGYTRLELVEGLQRGEELKRKVLMVGSN